MDAMISDGRGEVLQKNRSYVGSQGQFLVAGDFKDSLLLRHMDQKKRRDEAERVGLWTISGARLGNKQRLVWQVVTNKGNTTNEGTALEMGGTSWEPGVTRKEVLKKSTRECWAGDSSDTVRGGQSRTVDQSNPESVEKLFSCATGEANQVPHRALTNVKGKFSGTIKGSNTPQ